MKDGEPDPRNRGEDQVVLISLQTALAASKRLKRGLLVYLIEMAIIQLMDDRKTSSKTQLHRNRR